MSLAAELQEIVGTLEAAQLICSLLSNDGLPDDDTANRAPKMLEAVLTIAIERVRLLRKVVVGANVALIEHHGNRALPPRKGDDPDVHLPARRGRRGS